MPALAEFKASIYRVTTDGRDGETRLVFDVPASDLAQALKLNLTIGRLLNVTISVEGDARLVGPTPHRTP